MELNIFFIVYRESFEAALILSIIWTVLGQTALKSGIKSQILALGSVLGFIISATVAIILYKFQEALPSSFIDYFNFSILFISAVLITQMCVWMSKHSKDIKGKLQKNINNSIEKSNYIGIIALVAFSIAREGIETVLFLSGTFIEASRDLFVNYTIFAIWGFLATLMTMFIFLKGFKFFKAKYFFLLSTIFLFITASSFVVKLIQGLVMAEIIPALKENIWDTSFLIDETSKLGGYFSSMTGYHSSPHLMTLIFFLGYWFCAIYFYWKNNKSS